MTVIGENAFTYQDSLKSVIIPSSVTKIADASEEFMSLDGAFNGCTNLTAVTLPESLTTIGTFAFQGCTSLKSINFPNSITSIGDYAFQSCEALTSLPLPNGLVKIGSDAFGNCPSLTSLTIPNSVTSIAVDAFMACENLTSATIPSSVTLLDGGSPFAHCYKLTAIHVDSKNPNHMSEAGVLFNKNKTTLMMYPSNKAGTSYTIPSTVTSMDNACFMYCKNLKSGSITVKNHCV